MKPLIVGEAPARTGDPMKPLEGPCGIKLAAVFGITYDEYLETFSRLNVLPEWPGRGEKGDQFPMALAREHARQIVIEKRTTFLLGKRVAQAFGFLPKARFLSGYFSPAGEWRIMIIPHPSGINIWWNDPANVRRAKKEARRFLKDGLDRDAARKKR